MSASQSHQDALIGGLWTAFFHQLEGCFGPSSLSSLATAVAASHSPRPVAESSTAATPLSLEDFFRVTKATYFKFNVYELYGHVAHRAYAATPTGRTYSRYPIELKPLLCGGEDGEPDYEGIRQLQHRWRQPKGSSTSGIKIWLSDRSVCALRDKSDMS
jgi:hypothetical protein